MKFDPENLRRLKMSLSAAYTFADSLALAEMDGAFFHLDRVFTQINEAVRTAKILQREYEKYLKTEVRRDAARIAARSKR